MNAITTRQPVLTPSSFTELVQFAKMAANSSLVPRDYIGKPENIMLAVQMGSELGLSAMQAIQNIAVFNGRPTLWGDAMLGLVRASPLCEDVAERIDGSGMERTATCTVKRRGTSPIVAKFTAEDAKRAGLWGKAGPWQQYPDRMLQMRARGFALRDAFPDVLRGLITSEEAADIPPHVGPTIEAQPEPVVAEPPQPVAAPDPLAILKARLAKCSDHECVVRAGEWWQANLDRAEAAGKLITPLIRETAMDMLADRLGQFQQPVPEQPPSLEEEFGDGVLA